MRIYVCPNIDDQGRIQLFGWVKPKERWRFYIDDASPEVLRMEKVEEDSPGLVNTVDEKGRIIIPAYFRKRCGFTNSVDFGTDNGELVLKKPI